MGFVEYEIGYNKILTNGGMNTMANIFKCICLEENVCIIIRKILIGVLCSVMLRGALRVKISRGAPLEVQNGTQQDLNKMIDLVNLGGKKSVYMLKMWGFEMGPNKIWIK